MALRTRRNRRQKRAVFKVFTPKWIDPYPYIAGTEPEKRVFAALLDQLHVYFIFQGQVPEFESGGAMFSARPVNYKPDFVLPEYKVIIDPFGAYHHSLADQAQKDAEKIALYSAAGYAYYHPWTGVSGTKPGEWVWDQRHNLLGSKRDKTLRKHYGIEESRYPGLKRQLTGKMNTMEMLLAIPEIAAGPRYPLKDMRDIQAKAQKGFRIGENLGAGARSVAAANAKRRKPKSLAIRTRR